ncbi:potassium-transporting ATPase subunit KdpC [Actinacidiphila yanglinensis]|uniref:potassium-transporting ATPase subunit KdpC n=1 Tax=Actinacidiphila yanglinensis TaxID=310779 RepID=UPI002246CA2A|nr:potassium-transporting ATPase subunit KdpC [Actinacidiphila yanglinensis]
MRNHLAALRMLLVFTVICGLAYPLLVTGVAQAAFPGKANGSQVKLDGKTVGSSLIGQNFNLPLKKGQTTPSPDPKWFQPRPSAGGYDPTASGASNLGPNDPGLVKTIKERRAAVAAFDGVNPKDVPADAITASGSGLDPDISKAYAAEQVNRVANARDLSPAKVRSLVSSNTHTRAVGFLGEPYVNVVTLNLALAKLG